MTIKPKHTYLVFLFFALTGKLQAQNDITLVMSEILPELLIVSTQ